MLGGTYKVLVNRRRVGLARLAVGALVLAVAACGGGDDTDVDLPEAVPSAAQLCNSIGVLPRIRNGTVCTQPERAPVVPLFVSSQGSTKPDLCSGTVVGPRQVLTAAHCLSSRTRMVELPLWENGTIVRTMVASRWVVHPAYRVESSGFVNDAAVVTFDVDLPNPQLPLLTSQAVVPGQRIYLAGWGLPVFDLVVGYADVGIVNATHFGYVYDGVTSNTCSGDSGGPAYRLAYGQPALVGITSTGTTSDCNTGDRSMFTHLQSPAVLNFVRTHVVGLREI